MEVPHAGSFNTGEQLAPNRNGIDVVTLRPPTTAMLRRSPSPNVSPPRPGPWPTSRA